MKIGIYVLDKYAKQAYKNDCYDARINAGISVVADILIRKGYNDISYASSATVTRYDVILFSVTSDCDWWAFIEERAAWEPGSYKVCVGGAGVLNVRPFLEWVDYFMFGRAEGVVNEMIAAIERGEEYESEFVCNSKTFSADKKYKIKQVDRIYEHDVQLSGGGVYHEDTIGCNHRCLFCGYTWHRKQTQKEEFQYSGLWSGGVDRERAIIDMHNGTEVDLNKLRTTAIDGMSERLRFAVNKRISRDMLREFMERIAGMEKPHQIKLYNIIGYPTETTKDWEELLEDIVAADTVKREKQTCILLHSTPFRAMPATPMACAPMSKRGYRGEIAKYLGGGKYSGNIFYQGNALWCVESMGVESLTSVAESAIVWRGTEEDADAFVKVAMSQKYKRASSDVRLATLERYFDLDKLFGAYSSDNLPTRYLGTYCSVEKMWGKTKLEKMEG